MPTCTIFSLLFFGSKADDVFLSKLHFALRVFIVFTNTKIPPKNPPNIMKIQLFPALQMLLSKFPHTLGNSQGFILTLNYNYHNDKLALPGNL